MSTAPEPVESVPFAGTPEISEAAQVARERLHQEIERVRNGVEEMLDEQEARGNDADQGNGHGQADEDLRRELESLRIETRDYVKKKVRKSEKRLERSVREIDARTDALERRIDQVEANREETERRIDQVEADREEAKRRVDQVEAKREEAERRIDQVEAKREEAERRIDQVEANREETERRIDEVEADREEAEWRIHNSTEEMLDGLLDDIRSIADRLIDQPAPEPVPEKAPVGRVGSRPLGMRTK
jgi:chromosome segregation ATPase